MPPQWRTRALLRSLAKGVQRHHVIGGNEETIMSGIESPCILVCSIDMKTGYCFGCGRTRDEISSWLTMTPAERSAVTETLSARLETVERRPRRETRRARMARERGSE
jgi:predicted Fe-S protein YdhL (DUF1289 family)